MHDERWASLSEDGVYRWLLGRGRRGLQYRTLGVYGVNPSKADHEINDPTVTKLIGFADRLGYDTLLLANKAAYRATDVNELKQAADPIGPENDGYIKIVAAVADTVVYAWGPLAKLPVRLRQRWRDVDEMVRASGHQPMCWGTAQDGHPRHPLMLAYDTPLVPWYAPDVAHLV